MTPFEGELPPPRERGGGGGPTQEMGQLTQLQIQVAHMEGMLSQALMGQSNRISNLEQADVAIFGQLGVQSGVQADHGARIKVLEQSNDGRVGRVTGIAGMIVGLVGTLIVLIELAGPGAMN